MPDYSLVETPEELEKVVRALARDRVIGVDTEADSFYHYFDKLCLIQVAGASGIYLIDPLALPEQGLAPFGQVLADPAVRVIFHAADYDLYVLQRYGGLKVNNIFDTMLSAQLLGYQGVGLGALVERHFGVRLSKDQQRTDWSRRPLKEAQREYAASDVRYLAELAAILERELREKKRLSWAQHEFKLLEERDWPERKFDKEGYLRIKGSKRLTSRQLSVLRELFHFRDKRARAADKPPFKVLGNGTLLDLAQNPPKSRRALAQRRGVTDLVLRRYGAEMLEAIRVGLEGPEHAPIQPRKEGGGRRRLDRRGELRLEQLKRWRAQRSKDLGMDPGVLCPNALLEEIAWADPRGSDDLERIESLRGWRLDALGKDVLELLQSTPRPDPEVKAARPRERRRPRGPARSAPKS